MTGGSAKPVIFISYSHKDEPDNPGDGEVAWLSYVQSFLAPAVKNGVFEVWVDKHKKGGDKWDAEIKAKLAICDICILLASRHSLASDYVVKTEIKLILERQANGDKVRFYPILLSPVPKKGLELIDGFDIRPPDAKSLSGFRQHERDQSMAAIADEIAEIVEPIAKSNEAASKPPPDFVDIDHLPETPYERLVGRDDELARLDAAWEGGQTNIQSLVAEGGAGKSSLVNEWLLRLQQEQYRGAEAVLGWSFYSQGSKQRATTAEQFLDWAIGKLALALDTTSATVKGEAIAEALATRRVLLLLDGVEPLQHGPGPQFGQLKDQGLRQLLRRFAAMPTGADHGLVVLTSRVAVLDIGKWKGAAPVTDLEKLSEEAGAQLLKENGVWGTDDQISNAVEDFEGQALALSLLASYLKIVHDGDVRRRDHMVALMADADDPRHEHARRVMKSIEREWLADSPVLLAIMRMVGLFDRPASGDCLDALRASPAIGGLTDAIVDLGPDRWRRSVADLRQARLLAPPDTLDPGGLDAHPLVREWFGGRLEVGNEGAWRAAHGRLYEHLRATEEGDTPSLADLTPLYQAISHGCRAGRYQEALDEIYIDRIIRRRPDGELEYYSKKTLGATGSDLAAISWFFDTPFVTPVATLDEHEKTWVLAEAAFGLRGQGRIAEALPAMRTGLQRDKAVPNWENASIIAHNFSEAELVTGEVAGAMASAARSVEHADESGDSARMIFGRTIHANALHAAGRREEAEDLFAEAVRRQREWQPDYPLLYSLQGYHYCDLLICKGEWAAARDHVLQTLEWMKLPSASLLDIALNLLSLGQAHLGLALETVALQPASPVARDDASIARTRLDESDQELRRAGQSDYIPHGLLARAGFRRALGDWQGAERDLEEVEEIAALGPMRLHLCDMALEAARLAFARIEAFAPLNGLAGDSPPEPNLPDAAAIEGLKAEAGKRLAFASETITECGYHKRDAELAELDAILAGKRRFAALPPRV